MYEKLPDAMVELRMIIPEEFNEIELKAYAPPVLLKLRMVVIRFANPGPPNPSCETEYMNRKSKFGPPIWMNIRNACVLKAATPGSCEILVAPFAALPKNTCELLFTAF